MRVFGITGPIGHGKSVLAEALMKLEQPSARLESSEIISEVANEWLAKFPRQLLLEETSYAVLNTWIGQLAQIVSKRLRPVDVEQLKIDPKDVQFHPEYTKKLFVYIDLIRQGLADVGDTITQDNKDRHRPLLQWLGGYLVAKVDRNIWFSEIEKRLKQAEDGGMKLFVVGGLRYPNDAKVIKDRGGIIIKLLRKDLPEREKEDITERERDKIVPDTTVVSDDTPEALAEVAKAIYNDLLLEDLLPEYNIGDFKPLVE